MNPVNPQASAEARALLSFLQEICGRRTLAGQHEFCSSDDTFLEAARRIGGKTPAVWGGDFSFAIDPNTDPKPFHHCGPLNLNCPRPGVEEHETCFLDVSCDTQRDRLIAKVREKHAAGHIITLMWHHPFPTWGHTSPGNAVWTFADGRPTDEQWADLTTPGTELHAAWTAQADEIARYLKMLRDDGIPVLWRPYHEMNGVWFWWCNRPGEAGFRKLYRQLYDRFVNHHKLENLLWVWNPNAPRDRPGDEAFPYADFYPGHDVVDVLAADVYRGDYRKSSYDSLRELADGKPIALGEVGHLPTPEVLEDQPEWTWFMCWGYFIDGRGSTPDEIRNLYSMDRVCGLQDDAAARPG